MSGFDTSPDVRLREGAPRLQRHIAEDSIITSICFGVLTAFAMFMAIIEALTLLPKLILMMKLPGPDK